MNMGQLVEQGTEEVFPLGFEPASIGRHSDNEIILPDGQVSRHHAEIVMQGGRWLIADLGSANGTYVNGERLTGPQVLNHGDLVRVGQTRFRVEIAAAIAAQDTLVERTPAVVAVPPAKRSTGLYAALAVAAIAAVLLGVFVIWPLIRGSSDTADEPSATPGTAVAANPTSAEATSPPPTMPARPTATALPTIPPPTTRPTSLPPTEAPPTVTKTPAPKPVIGEFSTIQDTIAQGECTRLEWNGIENANRITLSDVGRVGTSGRIDVCLDATKTYTLQATGTGGSIEERVKITVQDPAGPIIEYFRVIPSIISPGDCAQLEWGKVENATLAEIEPGIGGVATPGEQEICPGTTTTYVLSAQDPTGTSVARAMLLVSSGTEPKPVISFFTANPASIQAGECTTLSWGKVDYATTVSIDNNIGGVASPESREVCLGTTTTFLMTAQGPGGTTEFELAVNVSPGKLADLPNLVIESILFEPNPCYRGQKCKVRIKMRNDGPVDAGHFIVRWTPEGEGQIPVEWDLDSLGAGQERELVYPWIPSRTNPEWWTVAIADLNDEITEIEEGAANSLEQFITVFEP
jgi:pSer/pThr/pTyr-binding forkhead associated (FHA) protein